MGNIEKMIQEKGLNAPRLTPQLIEETIIDSTFHKLTDVLTVCVLTLRNGFTVTGESACASPANYNKEIGEKIARENAVEKIWVLEGCLLKERLYNPNALAELTRFQTDRGLDTNEYVFINEAASIVEELLEADGLDVPKENRPMLKEELGGFFQHLLDCGVANVHPNPDRPVDAFCDIVTFCDGAILKQGYEPELALLECGKVINSRVGTMVDGKFEKDLSVEAQSMWHDADYDKARRV